MSRCKYIFAFIVIAWGIRLHGQASDKLPLAHVLDSLSATHSIHFSYLDQTVDSIRIPPPKWNEDVQVLVIWLSSVSGLVVEQTGKREYAILSAQTNRRATCGWLIDEESKEPIVGALVYTGESVAISQTKGIFSIQSNPGTAIHIQHIGFETKVIGSTSDHEGCATYSLTPAPTILEEINVYNYLSDGINKAADGSVMLSVNPARLMPGQVEADVLHAIQFLPGVQSVNETVSDLNIRGGTMDQNLILFDGMRVYQQGHFFGQLSVFNPYLIKQARVIKHGTSVQFGDAVSGTIQLETGDQVATTPAVTVGSNLLYSDIGIALPVGKKASIEISGRRSTGDLLNTPIYRNFFDKSFSNTEVFSASSGVEKGFHFYDASVKANYKPDQHTSISLSGISVNNQLEFDEVGLQNNDLLTKTSRLSQSSQIGSLTVRRKHKGQARTTLQLGASHYMLNASNNNIADDQILDQENQVLDYQLKSVTQLLGRHQDDWLLGYQFNNIGVLNSNQLNNPSFRDIQKRVNSIHALFGEYNRDWKSLHVRVGTRIQYYQEAQKIFLEPRLSLLQSLSNAMKVELTMERKSQSLFQKIDLQDDFFGIEKRRWNFPVATDFMLIESRQLSAGYHYQGFRWLVDVEGYYKSVSNIRSLSQGFVNQLEKLNLIGSNDAYGAEFLSTYQHKELKVWLSYSFMNNDYSFADFTPSVFSNNTEIPHNISWGSTYRYKSFEIAGALNWRSGIPYTGIESTALIGNQVDYDTPNQLRVGNYIRADLSIQYKHSFGRSKIVTGASVWNILNQKNILRKYYAINDADELTLVENEALPTTFNVFIRWSFPAAD